MSRAPAQEDARTAGLIEAHGDVLRPIESPAGSGSQGESGEERAPSSPTPSTPSSVNLEAALPLPSSASSDKDNQAGRSRRSRQDSWISHKARSVQRSWPRTSRIARRIYRFIRGPSPPMPLPRTLAPCSPSQCSYLTSFSALKPWLDRTYSVRGNTLTLRLESTIIKYTRPLQPAPFFWIFTVGYIIAFAFFARANYFLTPADSFIGCTSTYWLALDGCGLNGTNCEPFTDFTFDFRCPAQCKGVTLANFRTVGVEAPVYVPLVVGGGDQQKTYRSDSFICAAAVHAYVVLYALLVKILTHPEQRCHFQLTRRVRQGQLGRKLYELSVLHRKRDNVHRLPIRLSVLFPRHAVYDTLTLLRPTKGSPCIQHSSHVFPLPCPPSTPAIPLLDARLRRVLAHRAVLGPC